MNISQQREYVANAYPGENWREKVEAMHDDQIIVVYFHIREARGGDPAKTTKSGQLRLF